MHVFIHIFLLSVVFLLGTSLPAPDKTDSDKDTPSESNNHEEVQLSCIPTPWGCIDVNDPAIRPTRRLSNSENKEETLVNQEGKMCIPTAWGCIDINDPSIRPTRV
ncbi:uncharacterized protein LOC143192751 [Rhynchophorus ferrugineus]|uniref:uncharacterized protein LOC143192751 n=1 Tax=Rhynchophorus ferrugineus TaxID=354439 RepID=UPI003FCE1926